MIGQRSMRCGIASVMAILAVTVMVSGKAQTGIQREVLIKQDLPIPGYQTLLVAVTIAAGGREGRHSHPGTLVGHVLEGELTLELEGQPTKTVKAGESVLIEPGQVHEGINRGSVPVKALATFIVEKDKPLTTPVP